MTSEHEPHAEVLSALASVRLDRPDFEASPRLLALLDEVYTGQVTGDEAVAIILSWS